jgi:Nodulation protein Z (NodZ)
MTRYVVSIRMTGLGDRLICLGAAWLFARNTGRTLVADWRHGAYAQSAHQDVFGLCFTAAPELAAVKFIGDDRVGHLQLPRPPYPALWNDDGLLRAAYRRPADTIFAPRDAAVALMRGGGDVAASTVVFDSCVSDGLVSLADSRTFLSSLRPRDELTTAAAAFRNKHLGAARTSRRATRMASSRSRSARTVPRVFGVAFMYLRRRRRRAGRAWKDRDIRCGTARPIRAARAGAASRAPAPQAHCARVERSLGRPQRDCGANGGQHVRRVGSLAASSVQPPPITAERQQGVQQLLLCRASQQPTAELAEHARIETTLINASRHGASAGRPCCENSGVNVVSS